MKRFLCLLFVTLSLPLLAEPPVDKALLSDAQKVDYYFALFEFSRDLSGNSGMVERLSIPDRAVYRTRLFELLEPESELYRRPLLGLRLGRAVL